MSSARSEQESTGHVQALDGIRGIAILLVLLLHTTILQTPILDTHVLTERIVWQVALVGWAGVDLFFVLSGFLITGILLDAKGGRGYFGSFYARRFLRIFPLYYAFLTVVLLAVPRFAPTLVHDAARLESRQIWFWTYLTNIGMAFHADWNALPHFWSLAVEEQFYLLWPAVVLMFNAATLRRLTQGLFVAALATRLGLLFAGVRPEAVFVLTPARMDTLAVGALIAILSRDEGTRAQLSRWSLLVLRVGSAGLIGIIVVTGTLAQYDPLVQTLGYSLLALWFGALLVKVISASPTSRLRRIMTWGGLRHLGLRSYALYVVHPMALIAVRRFAQVNGLPRVLGSGMVSQVVFWMLCLGLSLAVAEASWHLLEKRCLSLKRYFPYPRPVLSTAASVTNSPSAP